jgi:hypothetical protein
MIDVSFSDEWAGGTASGAWLLLLLTVQLWRTHRLPLFTER